MWGVIRSLPGRGLQHSHIYRGQRGSRHNTSKHYNNNNNNHRNQWYIIITNNNKCNINSSINKRFSKYSTNKCYFNSSSRGFNNSNNSNNCSNSNNISN